ncbi:hypothetical protein [Halolamina sp.]|jgi:hypothetical protein|uniref:DUF7562 family protein n=1 Tax=Halolamina sp. TaxID=1940283 RepID=UPI000223B987|nr:hypothetical protein Halar_0910 [halophilic archaeon DL31]
MWRRSDRSGNPVVCIACGDEPTREQAREYDKEGDRWDRRGKEFEYLCKDCFGDLTHQPRHGLEATLEEACTPGQTAEEFVRRYLRAAAERADEDPRE